jgi:hypothetical protein
MADKYIIIIGIMICGFAVFGFFITPFLENQYEMITRGNSFPTVLVLIPFFCVICGVVIIAIGIACREKTSFKEQYEVDRIMVNKGKVIGVIFTILGGSLFLVSLAGGTNVYNIRNFFLTKEVIIGEFILLCIGVFILVLAIKLSSSSKRFIE